MLKAQKYCKNRIKTSMREKLLKIEIRKIDSQLIETSYF